MKKESFGNLQKYSGIAKLNESALEARDAQIKLLEQQLDRQEYWVDYWKSKYERSLEELKKNTKSRIKWWRF